jgi:hypothetical protein
VASSPRDRWLISCFRGPVRKSIALGLSTCSRKELRGSGRSRLKIGDRTNHYAGPRSDVSPAAHELAERDATECEIIAPGAPAPQNRRSPMTRED